MSQIVYVTGKWVKREAPKDRGVEAVRGPVSSRVGVATEAQARYGGTASEICCLVSWADLVET